MIHTVQFYLKLQQDDIDKLKKLYSIACSKINLKNEDLNLDSDTFLMHICLKNNTCRLKVDMHNLLDKKDISKKDITIINKKINKFLDKFLVSELDDFTLTRIDYYRDILYENKKNREIIFEILQKSRGKYYNLTNIKKFKKFAKNKGSLYYISNTKRINIYDKTEWAENTGKALNERDINAIRFECQLYNKHLNYLKKYYKIEKKLENYITDEMHNKYMDLLGKFIYEGDFYDQ